MGFWKGFEGLLLVMPLGLLVDGCFALRVVFSDTVCARKIAEQGKNKEALLTKMCEGGRGLVLSAHYFTENLG